jgi:ATP-dependent exoDNAse (exonuclease V) beta subunit
MIRWLKDNDFSLTQAAREKLYVAVTRARSSVAFVLAKNDIEEISDLPVYRLLSIRGCADQEHGQAV